MAQVIDPELKERLLGAEFRPAVTLWNRLEGRARKEAFERSLRAEVRDPLWMMARQWQLGEFQGADAGSAAKVRLSVDTARIDRFAPPSGERSANGIQGFQPAVPYDDSAPLEMQAEREAIWPAGAAPRDAYVGLRAQMGRHFVRLLRAAGFESLRMAFAGRFGFEEVREDSGASETERLEAAHVHSDPAAWQTFELVLRRLPDGRRLLVAIEDGEFDSFLDTEFDTTARAQLKALGQAFRSWFQRTYSQPATSSEQAWAPSHLEYQFAVSAPAEGSEEKRTLLVAEQYHQGHLDWYAFETESRTVLADSPGRTFPGGSFRPRPPVAVVPAPVEFNGMPNVRFWEFEDRKTDFGNISASTTDVALLLLAEFGLVYGNDWSVIPYDLEVGTLAEVKGLVVTDVFGVRTLIGAAGEGQAMDWQAWSMYTLSPTVPGAPEVPLLLLPPALAKVQESAPLEQVLFARDEMTNTVWGVEERIPGVLGWGVDGFGTATRLSRYFREHAPASGITPEESGASIRYVLGTSVPENWIPFVARQVPGSQRLIRLQRAAMPRLTDAIPDSRVEPRGAVLRVGLDGLDVRQPYFVHEEEVPRAGTIVTRSFQRTRWFDGRVYTWIGRRKETGRGEGASGLEFDRVVPNSNRA